MSRELLTRFEKFEQNNNLFDLTVEEVPIWERIRHAVLNQVLFRNIQNKPDHIINTMSFFDSIYHMGENSFNKNPYFSDSVDIVVYGSGRRRLEPNGKYWDIYFDPIYEGGLNNYVHLEPVRQPPYNNPRQTNNIRYTDLIEHGSKIPLKLGLKKPIIPNKVRNTLIKIENKIDKKFNVEINLRSLVCKSLYYRKTRHWLYKQLLKIIDPNILILVCSYGTEGQILIEVAKSLEIPVVELQHGIISKRHLGYSYKNATKRMFPDYLLVWGDIWKESASIPLPDERIISTGYPYLSKQKANYGSVNSTEQIIFLSQASIGDELSKIASKLSQYDNIDYDIIYKLHPNEYENWENRYPRLLEADLRVIGENGPELYNLFAESSIQVGVYSTALFEGIEFGLSTYVYKISGWEYVKNLVSESSVQAFSSNEELINILQDVKHASKNTTFFEKNATHNTINEINRIKAEGTTFNRREL